MLDLNRQLREFAIVDYPGQLPQFGLQGIFSEDV